MLLIDPEFSIVNRLINVFKFAFYYDVDVADTKFCDADDADGFMKIEWVYFCAVCRVGRRFCV